MVCSFFAACSAIPFVLLFSHQSVGLLLGDEPQQRLFHTLFHRYDRRLRPPPIAPNKSAVQITVTIVLGILIEMRENEQVAAYVISQTQRWHDKRLTWDPQENGNISELIVPQKMLWQPKMFVYNSMDTKEMLNEEKYDVRLRWDGLIKVNIPQFVTCTCRLGIEQFPFDSQFCAVALASPLLTINEMEVNTTQPPSDSYFAGNSEWNLINVSVRNMHYLEEGEYRAEVHFVFNLRRRPIFYITVIVVPIFLISALSILGIFTPGSNEGPRSEKVSLGLGSLLAMTVLLGIVAGAMPKSNSIPLLGYYILSVILLCAIAVAVSMAFMTSSKRYVDNARIPSKFTYRMSLVRPQMYTVRRAEKMERMAQQKGQIQRTKSISHQILGVRFSEAYKDGGRYGERHSLAMANYGSIDSGGECRNGKVCADDRGRATGRGRRQSNLLTKLTPNGNANTTNTLLLGGELSLMHRRETAFNEQSEEDGSTTGERRKSAQETADLSSELARIRTLLTFVVDSQREFRAKLDREQTREKIEREWGRVFMKFDYVCLAVFQLLNLFSLLFFLKFAWSESPKEPEKPLV
ncbi:hypothetical protein niasHS_003877 [Heterodera schachtii]|uniref:Uncharacterized protein n=1 Tax=Heterodera schachtii TaxID=97005 RepID=A0ABD2K3Q1_HETSC